MEAKAVGRYLRVTPRKARYVLDTVRGKSVEEALAILKFVPNEAAMYIRQIVESAIANAEHNYAMDRETLRICRAYVDDGPSLKRIHPRAMGRAYRILRRMSHITVVLTEDETLKKAVAKPKGRRAAGGRKAAAQAAPVEEKKVSKRGKAEAKAKRTKPVPEEPAPTAEVEAIQEEKEGQ